MKPLTREQLGWRSRPGILGKHPSSPQSVHALLGYFLKDRHSPTPFPGRDMLTNEGLFDWGIASPLEKVIEGPEHMRLLLEVPELYRQSVAIVEPWANVGLNPQGESVRASKNIAYLLQQIADADTVLFPVWQSGIDHADRMANVLSAGIATVIQGGHPSVHDPGSFNGSKAGLDDLLGLVTQVLVRRTSGSGPSIFICLGHQLAAAAHVQLIKRATREVLALTRLPLDPAGRTLSVLQKLCKQIVEVGEHLPIMKKRRDHRHGLGRTGFCRRAQRGAGSRHAQAAAVRAPRPPRPRARNAARDPRVDRRRTRRRHRRCHDPGT
jgi:hypothetical protein